MRNSGFIAWFFLLFFSAGAQNSQYACRFGIEMSYGITRYTAQCLYPSLVYSTGRHTVFAGPGIYYVQHNQPKPFVGAQAGYRFSFINTRNLNLFCEYDINFVNGTFSENDQQSYHSLFGGVRERHDHLVAIDNYLSLGLKWNMSSRFYATCLMGAGFGLYKEDYTYRFYNADTYSQTGPMAFRYGVNLIAKVGIGLNMFGIKKP